MFFRRKKPAPPTFEQRVQAARERGFTVEPAPGGASRVRIARYGVAAIVEPDETGRVRFVERPGVMVDGQISRLEDRGYQKFLLTNGRSRPALASQLRQLHDFTEEARHLFGLTTLYNASLGTVSDRYHYDRLEGRK
jgi:hypothetical protein